MFAQGRPARSRLADLAPPSWPRARPTHRGLDPIYARIEEVSSLAGDPTRLDELPQPPRPVRRRDLDAAADLTLDERMEMVAGMVEGLATRLAEEDGPPEDWARLIVAYGVLGRSREAIQTFDEAGRRFADDPAAMDVIDRAADRAGISEAGSAE